MNDNNKTIVIKNQTFQIFSYPYGFRVCEETLGSRYRTSAFLATYEGALAKIQTWI